MFREKRKLHTSAINHVSHVDASVDMAGPTIAIWELWRDDSKTAHPLCGAEFSRRSEGTGTRSWKLGDTVRVKDRHRLVRCVEEEDGRQCSCCRSVRVATLAYVLSYTFQRQVHSKQHEMSGCKTKIFLNKLPNHAGGNLHS